MVFSKLTDYEFALLGLETYEKQRWSPEDVRTLRECRDEYQRRGDDMIALFRPAFGHVLTFHKIDSGTMTEDDVRSLESAGAGIAPDYRAVERKLRAVKNDSEQNRKP